MTFDISRTETFVPFLWIILKTITVITLFSLFSADVLRWKVAIPESHELGAAGIHISPLSDAWNRLIAVLLLLLVLCEHGMDMHIVSRSDVTQKVTKKTLTGLNTHIMNDVFGCFGLVYAVGTQQVACTQGHNGLLLASGLWFVSGGCLFVMETQIKRKHMHHEQERARRPVWQGADLPEVIQVASPVLCYIGVVFLMAVSVTSPCLHHVYAEMAYSEFCLRLLLYAFYVCGRCYTQGIPGESYIDEMPNLVLFGWLMLLPVALVYTSIAVSVAAYVRLMTSPSTTRKGASSSLLPSNVTDIIMPTPALPLAPYTAAIQSHPDSERPKLGENNADLMTQLQNIEKSMQMQQQPTSNFSTTKTSHASKRRTAMLF